MLQLNSFRIYNDKASAEISIDGIGKLDTNVDITKELLEEIKRQVYASAKQKLLERFEVRSEVIKVVDFNKDKVIDN